MGEAWPILESIPTIPRHVRRSTKRARDRKCAAFRHIRPPAMLHLTPNRGHNVG
jgi:hypothetical protein